MNLQEAMNMKSDLDIDNMPLPDELTKEQVLKLIDDDPGCETACGQKLVEPDNVENAIRSWIYRLEKANYAEDDAQMAVYDALAFLVEREVIADCPLVEDDEELKNSWIDVFNEKIYARLVAVGIDFSEG